MRRFVNCIGCARAFNVLDPIDNRAFDEHNCDMSDAELDALIAKLQAEDNDIPMVPDVDADGIPWDVEVD